ncbi:MAG: Fe2+/Zn2+ uptake regulation protein [Acidimicrobiales bacterium]|nr:Fe2+/Zn2+ uptake regulation protein [Acidimicrobiales bacterium]
MPDVDLHLGAAARLRASGQRYTSNRRAVVDVLADADRPLTIPELLERRALAQSSVYRNLAVLEESGVVRRVTSTDEFARFELAEDLTDHHHHHLICSTCGAVADFTVSDGLEAALARAMAGVAATGFQPEHHRLDLVGRCASCA